MEVMLPSSGIFQAKIDRQLLFQLVDNLVRNVRDHTPASTRCFLELVKRGEGVFLIIADAGPGLPAPMLESLNRGAVDEVAGVGLHLCQRIAETCGQQLTFAPRPGGGLQVEIGLPLS